MILHGETGEGGTGFLNQGAETCCEFPNNDIDGIKKYSKLGDIGNKASMFWRW